MFTGLIQDVGRVRGVVAEGRSVHLRIATSLEPALEIGDSLAINGVCLTVTSKKVGVVVATAVPETLSRTNLGGLGDGDRVNLEPALRATDRLGGHIVQGHVDGIGRVARIAKRDISVEVTIEAAPDILRYTVEKGSVAVDGVSLTVAVLSGEGSFTVALIPHTLGATTLDERAVGDRVNLEADILAKYVEKMIRGSSGPGSDGGRITEEFLRSHGFD